MALAIDASTPAIAVNSVSGTATVTTASFTPPAGALLLVMWAANNTATTNPSTPGITDSLGSPLTYTLLDWRSHVDTGPQVQGQVATWWAVVGSSAAMTVTVTNNNNDPANKQSALAVVVITGQHATPIGVHGKVGSSSASSIAQSYTAAATGGWGFLAACDWDATGTATAGTGCTLLPSGAGTIAPTQISYAFERRTTADDTNGSNNTLNLTLAGTSTNLQWAYVEVVPAAAAAPAGDPTPVIRPTLYFLPPGLGPFRRWVPVQPVSGSQNYTTNLGGSITPAGALANQTQKPLAGTLTSSGSLARQTGKSLAGATTPSGALSKQANKALAGATTPSGALTKTTAKALAGVITSAGSLTKRANKALAGTITSSGALTTIKVVLRSFAGTITSSGSLTRQANKAVTGTVTPAGAVTRLTQKALAAMVAGAGALAKLIRRPFAGSTTPQGTVNAATVGATMNAASTPTTAATVMSASTVAGVRAADSVSTTVASSPTLAATDTSSASVSGKTTSGPTVSDG